MTDEQGLLLCSRYAASPNFFGYCGPAESASLIDHLSDNTADSEVKTILSEFETLFPYLKLISAENNFADPFDRKVVEAYWVGNALLNNMNSRRIQPFLRELLKTDRKLNKKNQIKLYTKLNRRRFLPHHAFHVFNIFKRTGRDPSFQTLKSMDECRIGWGKITQVQSLKFKVQNENQNQNSNIKTKFDIFMITKPLVCAKNKLGLGHLVIKKIKLDYRGKVFAADLKEGDWVSFHWGQVCDKLTHGQVINLEYFTQKAIDYYNL